MGDGHRRQSRSPQRKCNTPRGYRKCVFGHQFVREQVDPRVKELFAQVGKKPNFGDLRRTWKIEHCRTVAPYGDCPYQPEDCGIAFLQAASKVIHADKPGALFRLVARSQAIQRAETKPSWGDAGVARGGTAPRSLPGVAEEVGQANDIDRGAGRLAGDQGRLGVRRTDGGFVRVVQVLRHYDPRPREGHTEDGEAST